MNTKYIQILKSFNKKEKAQFNKFLRSNFSNSNKNLIKLYSIIGKNFDNFNVLDKKIIYEMIYPGKKYSESTIEHINSEMLKITLKFKNCLNCINREENKNDCQMKQDNDTVIVNKQKIKEIIKDLYNSHIYNSEYFHKKYLYQKFINEKYKLNTNDFTDNVVNTYMVKPVSLINELIYFEEYSYIKKIEILIKNWLLDPKENTRNKIENYFCLLNEAISKIEKCKEIPLLILFKNLIYLKEKNSIENYKNLSHYLNKYKNEIDKDIQKIIYKILIHSLITNINSNLNINKIYHEELYDISTKFINEFSNFDLSLGGYYFIYFFINSCIELGKPDEADNILNNLSSSQTIDFENVKNLSHAKIFFSKGEYLKANEKLSLINKKMIWYFELEYYYLKSVCSLELGNINYSKNIISKFEHYLKNKNVRDYFTISGKKFIKNINDYIYSSNKNRKEDMVLLINKLDQDNSVYYSDWLKHKAELTLFNYTSNNIQTV